MPEDFNVPVVEYFDVSSFMGDNIEWMSAVLLSYTAMQYFLFKKEKRAFYKFKRFMYHTLTILAGVMLSVIISARKKSSQIIEFYNSSTTFASANQKQLIKNDFTSLVSMIDTIVAASLFFSLLILIIFIVEYLFNDPDSDYLIIDSPMILRKVERKSE